MTVDLTTVAVDPSVGGSEKILCADGTTPYHVTPDLLSAYAIDQIEAITPTVTITGSSAVYVLHGGVMSPVDIDYLTAYHLGIMWAKAAESAPDGADLVPLLDGSTQKTVTLTLLSELVRATIEATILDISDLADGSGAIATSDYMLVTQTTTGKRIQISDLSTLIYASLDSYVAALGAVTTTVDADVFYVIQGGVEKKCTAAELKTYIGASLDGSGTASTLAQWVDSDTLQAGPSVVLSATGFSGGSDVAIPTTLTVRGEMDMIIYDSTDIGAALVDADTILVDDGALGTTQRKSALSRVWTYIASKLATYAIDTLGAATDVTTLNASTTAHGLAVKATAPAAGLVNVVGIANTESAYTNKPLFDTTNPAALGSAGPGTQVIAARRDHIHANPAIDTLAAALKPRLQLDLDARPARRRFHVLGLGGFDHAQQVLHIGFSDRLPIDDFFLDDLGPILLGVDLQFVIVSLAARPGSAGNLDALARRQQPVHPRRRNPDTLLAARHPQRVKFAAVEQPTKNVRNLALDNPRPVVLHPDAEVVLVHLLDPHLQLRQNLCLLAGVQRIVHRFLHRRQQRFTRIVKTQQVPILREKFADAYFPLALGHQLGLRFGPRLGWLGASSRTGRSDRLVARPSRADPLARGLNLRLGPGLGLGLTGPFGRLFGLARTLFGGLALGGSRRNGTGRRTLTARFAL